eukprot:COSAG01_NODE_16013_length_1278_cov_14.687023_2_plen_75_part_00
MVDRIARFVTPRREGLRTLERSKVLRPSRRGVTKRIEQLRRWLSGRLTMNININNSKGHRVPHPGRILNLTLVY